jgi:hypothetical protein
VFVASRITVTDEAQPLVTDYQGSTLLVRNADSALSVFVGGEDVTANDGFELPPEGSLRLPIGRKGDLPHAVAADANEVELHVLIVT